MQQSIPELFPTQVGMFRVLLRAFQFRRSIPHPSGDVPQTMDRPIIISAYSPPKWGCSAYIALSSGLKLLFPTQVGMFRPAERQLKPGKPIPHPSGDVPIEERRQRKRCLYSPPKWGCSAIMRSNWACPRLFPTQVGMFREIYRSKALSAPIPHPSGDVPVRSSDRLPQFCYSPPKWGCSAIL